jgi:hypothetical protein
MMCRLATTLLISVLCIGTMSLAWPEARFGLAQGMTDQRVAARELRALAVHDVTSVPALSALLAMLTGAAAQRTSDAETLASRAPLNTYAWFDLARVRFASGAPLEKIARALEMSQITGPNEPRIMGARAALGLPLWGGFSPTARRSVIVDLTRGGWGQMTEDQRVAIRLAVARAPLVMRDELRVALEAAHAENLIRELPLASQGH